MKRSYKFASFAVSAAVLFAGCSGGESGGTRPDIVDDPIDLPPPDSDEWKRNPTKDLACAEPLTTNTLSSPMQRLSNVEIANSIRALLAGVADPAQIPHVTSLAPESGRFGYTNNVAGQEPTRVFADALEEFAVRSSAAAVSNLAKLGCANTDGSCVGKFVRDFGKRVFRRPLTDVEVGNFQAAYDEARKAPYNFDHAMALETVVGSLFQSPQFVYRIEEGTGDVTENGGKSLSGYDMASRLSYLFWDSMPDADLFAAAERGDLSKTAEIEKQARRLLNDDRSRQAVLTFYNEWLHFDRFSANVSVPVKDRAFFPDFSDAQSEGLKAGFHRTVESAFFDGDHSLEAFFASSRGFVNDDTASIYGVEKPGSKDLVEVQLNAEQRAGIITNAGFMSGLSHGTEGASILRGGFVMDRLLCAPSPPPPEDIVREIPFSQTEAITYRQRVENTAEKGQCASCHMALDAFGFLFENYNPIGAWQDEEQARFKGETFRLPVDSSSTISGTLDLDGAYPNAIPFMKKLAKSEQAAQCLVENWWLWANARTELEEDGCAIVPLTTAFLKSGGDMQELLVELAKSAPFRFRSAAQ
ncbi:MAG: DUF1592 domain-containing protein [Deltaproteobacteria bacterium]|nr:DUF1592 domain-containing protein [Deltaproteobacteria bacterium]